MANVALLPTDVIPQAWPVLAPFVEQMTDSTTTTDGFRDWLSNGQMQAWVAVEDHKAIAAMVTEVHTFQKGKVCRMVGCVGEGMQDWLQFLPEVEAWARKEGCVKMQPIARPGWSRVLSRFGYKETHRLLEKDL